MLDSFRTRSTINVGQQTYALYSLERLEQHHAISHLPFSLKILLENLLRLEDGQQVTREDISALCHAEGGAAHGHEIAFMPSRVLLQDFTGVPAVVDFAAMRDAMQALGGQAEKINPLQPAELVIDHSVQVDNYGSSQARDLNAHLEFKRNEERYQFLRWGQQAFANFSVVPPNTGIVHQVNLEYLARVVFIEAGQTTPLAYPDTLVGTDSHTTMINGLGVLGWGVGGIEAEAAMLGQAITMLVPDVIGFQLSGRLPEGTTATDLVLTVTQLLRQKGVVGKFVEFYGDGLSSLPLADRATIANMAPEYGATCGFFPIDQETLRYLTLSGRSRDQVALVEAYAKAQGLFREDGQSTPHYQDSLHLDMSTVEPSIAGPKRPQDRLLLRDAKAAVTRTLREYPSNKKSVDGPVGNGAVVIAAITSCTNTSNPAVMIGAGLLAKNAVERGLSVPAWVKTSLAPGSKVVTEYLKKAGLLSALEALHFHVVGYGCTTCIGNSGPLDEAVSQAIQDNDLTVCAVLSGNRNFEGRIHPQVRLNYLASPPLVVAFALAGRMDVDLYNEPLGHDKAGQAIYLKDIWPSTQDIQALMVDTLQADMFRSSYNNVFAGSGDWNQIKTPTGSRFAWQDDSTYIRQPPYFANMQKIPAPVHDITGARVLVKLGDSVTTDHISPAGAIAPNSPAGQYLQSLGVAVGEFNSYGSRRGNHEVMMRGTFANVRLRNQLVPGSEGSRTVHIPSADETSIFDAAMRYLDEGVASIVLAGKEYGSGSSRDWAAKGPRLLGVRAVIAKSYERIHRSNLVGMGILPLLFPEGEDCESLGLSGFESYDITGLDNGHSKSVTVKATPEQGEPIIFTAHVRIDTPQEVAYFQHGGILHYVLRKLL